MRTMTHSGRPLALLCPVIEPVKTDLAPLRRCLEVCQEAGLRVGVVCNPARGELVPPPNDWYGHLQALLNDIPVALPLLASTPNLTKGDINGFMKWAGDRPIGIVHDGPLSAAVFQATLQVQGIIRHVVLPQAAGEAFVAAIPPGRRVMVDDPFVRQVRNADYGSPEFFSRAYLDVLPGIAGVGDYLCIGSKFKDGGGPAIAVAIHALTRAADGGLWLEHFVSDDQELAGKNIDGKFLEAARKLMGAVAARPQAFGWNPALEEYRQHANSGHSPGLGKSKELQMVHHMCVVLDAIVATA